MHIREFQELIREMYWHKDSQRPVEANFIYLIEEIGELGSAIIRGDKKSMEEELADALAWLVSVANALSIDIEEAALKRYGRSCPKCGKRHCECVIK
ncbi:MAG: nucleotide pyrophosphohydrolase [Candidatus Nezhaarchaeota archaeon]|nr:nucleotide pyrophosphohydrolase [Candidatus Nezhaarchaeota archaeon]MCX8141956.1 nucleotide pyrophosphohydrolase [Candidatus Nezhaarchaeota archaeon]MDW8050263.1 MazG nucleotide pyrophosphohydrolase domain-containing protein [Nitrososphaerota archaeon]